MSHSSLQLARALDLPARDAMLQQAPSVQHFWHQNRDLLAHAWQEWEEKEQESPFILDNSLIDSNLRHAVMQAWDDPAKEQAVLDLLQEVTPGVFQFQFFDPERLADLRGYLEGVWNAQIPLRPPYGIVLNRRGAMLDRRSEGYLAAPSFQVFYQALLDTYMRPISRLLFPEIMGYDSQTFGFSIHYQPNTDKSIRPHTDASSVTLNININLPEETFTGSSVDFFDPRTSKLTPLIFKPGTAMLHRGNIAHSAQPITSGERTNLVLWLYGENGRIAPPVAHPVAVDARERWSIPNTAQDNFAPF